MGKSATIEDVIEVITKERNKALNYLYKRYSMGDDDANDVFQESSLALYKNLQDGKLVDMRSTLSTYLLEICIHQACKLLGKKSKSVPLTDIIQLKQKDEYADSKIDELLNFGEESITTEQRQIMRDLVQNLPKPCDEILWYYYGDNLGMQTIADLLNYKNSDTAKSTKSRCMSKLKDKFNKIKNDFYER